MRLRGWISILALCLSASAFAAVPFWGARHTSPVGTPPAKLAPGQWVWAGDDKKAGPISVVVSLTEQRAYVYRNGILIGVSTISSGRKGYETPTGVFTILQKDRDHYSNQYNNAPMPYQQRLTWGGVALHAGGLPGYPESHGCVHLPTEFARKLFEASNLGMTVVVSASGKTSPMVVHPGPLSPIDPHTGSDINIPPLQDGSAWRWEPWRAKAGPVSVVLSRKDRMIVIYRDGVEIGRSKVVLNQQEMHDGIRAYVVAEGYHPPTEGSDLSQAAEPIWIAINLPGSEKNKAASLVTNGGQVKVPDGFKTHLLPLLAPGTVLVSTSDSLMSSSTRGHRQVIDADPAH